MKRRDVYDPEQFTYRVDYAAARIAKSNGRQPQGRHFDTCFEMNDGDYVVEALIRRASKNPKIAANLYSAINRHTAAVVHARLCNIPTPMLRRYAALARHRRAANP